MKTLKSLIISTTIFSVGLSLNLDSFTTVRKLPDIREFQLTRILNAPALSQVDSQLTNIFVSVSGELLGAQIIVPGAVLIVGANGELEVLEKDYTADVKYATNASTGSQVSCIGDTCIDYVAVGFPDSGKVSRIGNVGVERVAVGFPNGGKVSRIGNVNIEYFATGFPNGGKINSIGDVQLDYDNSGFVQKISANQTSTGVRISIIQR